MWPTIAVAILILFFLVVLTLVRTRQREKAWKKWGTSRGFSFKKTEQGPLIVGTIDRHSLEIRTAPHGSDTEGGVAVVHISLGLNNIPHDLELVGVPGFVGDLVRWKEGTIPTGDENFDRDVMLKEMSDQNVCDYWTPERRQAILELVNHSEYDQITLKNSELAIEYRSMTPGGEELDEVLSHLQSVALILEDSPTKH